MRGIDEYINEVKPDFDEVLKHQFNYTASSRYTPNSEKTLRQWFNAKARFIKHFNGKLIYDAGKYSFPLDDESRLKKLKEFIKTIQHQYEEYDLGQFIKTFANEFFTTQKTNKQYSMTVEVKGVGLRGIKIEAGTKIIKAFKYFIEDKAILDVLQIKASMLVQEDKIHGHLYLSVHPLDYLSASENTNNWRSCHALDGDYCAGNLSYMCDETTVICYLCGEDQKELPHFGSVKWNSKKWRMLLFVSNDEDVLFAGRHYPFFNKAIMDKIKEVWMSLFMTPTSYSKWHDDIVETFNYKDLEESRSFSETSISNPHIIINQYLIDPTHIIKDQSSLHYNDLLESSVYEPYYSFNNYWSPYNSRSFLFVGSDPYCPYCGDRRLYSSEHLCCDCCKDKFETNSTYVGECEGCGCDIFEEEDWTQDYKGHLYCQNCKESLLTWCPVCYNWYPNDLMVDLTKKFNKTVIINHQEEDKVCYKCLSKYDDIIQEKLIEEDSNG